eukprot:4616186-Pyramimonas_sp.AAC.1
MPNKLVQVQSSLGLARHRFDSTSKPGAILILTMLPIHMFVTHVWNIRKAEASGKVARTHLDYSSGAEGQERLVQIGMLADAADE